MRPASAPPANTSLPGDANDPAQYPFWNVRRYRPYFDVDTKVKQGYEQQSFSVVVWQGGGDVWRELEQQPQQQQQAAGAAAAVILASCMRELAPGRACSQHADYLQDGRQLAGSSSCSWQTPLCLGL